MNGQFDVKSYGAVGDGVTKDTKAIQAAIDAAADNQGGRVVLNPGVYLSGTIYLKSNVELHLMSGAKLLGSPNKDDYNTTERRGSGRENVSGAHLVVAYRVKNVSITGQGAIDGNASAFFGGLSDTEGMSYRYKVRPVDRFSFPWRPGQMVWFCRCKGVSVRDVTLSNSAYWTFLLLGCEDVRVRGLRIMNPPTTINGDGLGIDSCRNVTVSDCIIRSGDDSLTLRATLRATPCENVVVSNCVLSSPTSGIRIGVGDGIVRRCRLSNIIITDSCKGIVVVSRWSDSSEHGTRIEDIQFSDFSIDCTHPFKIFNSHKAQAIAPAGISRLSFKRFNIRSTGFSELLGDSALPLRDISFSDIQWRIAWDDKLAPYTRDYMLRAAHLEDSRFENIRIERDSAAKTVTEGIVLDKCRDVLIRRLEIKRNDDAPFARLLQSECANIRDESSDMADNAGASENIMDAGE